MHVENKHAALGLGPCFFAPRLAGDAASGSIPKPSGELL
jgi:hypothetical protein